MGSRWTYYLNCANCDEVNDVWYAPSCGFDTLDFTCSKCGKRNKVQETVQIELDESDESRAPRT